MSKGQIKIDPSKASKYSAGITGKASPLGSSKSITFSSETNLPVNPRCKSCAIRTKSMLSTYAAIMEEDAAKIMKIAQAFESVDRSAATQVKQNNGRG